MGNWLVVPKGTSLARRTRARRAAQYVRMSRELQRYSIKNQMTAIAAYADANSLTIVRTYADEGRSGLRIKGRPGLIELIEDVQSGQADFDHILVYDVSRWGRFQDVDESAYYEFLCKRSGVQVEYCAELFRNDGTFVSGIAKNLKRGMAAEWSRELSVKVHAGHCRVASLGYRVGAPVGYGLRRLMVDESEHPKALLGKGQFKALQSDRVRLQTGSAEETAVIRTIFDQFVNGRKSYSDIRRQLNDAGIANHNGRPWTDGMIPTILANENYIGKTIYNRTSRRLGQKLVKNPDHAWVRGAAAIEPIVDPGIFARAQKLLAERRVEIPENEMLLRLRLTLRRRGKLNSRIINTTLGLNHVSSYVKHFGSLRKAYALIGYVPPRDCDWIDTRELWAAEQARHADELAEALRTDLGLQVELVLDGIGLDVGGKRLVSFLVARRLARRGEDRAPQWKAYRRQIPSGLLAVMRLDAANKRIDDYVLLPASLKSGRYVWLSSGSLRRHRGELYRERRELFRAIKATLAKTTRAAPASSAPPKKRSKSRQPRAKGFGARRSQCGDTKSLR
ncbi:recombinase family protein [Bradyrhizobium sp. NBAIM20]|uniref:recombinase family protein n=1 Tax=unclassified Bradyrhizobium TaxID=2631580 RepID=UPI001CD297EA|nr:MULTISPECIES: recombinase family protein [unclassified Bradyrhizobium]MCA1411732.1 recombinase family protein [Bradyrhizobium sp. NBAIM20]MCA1460933.1 recombinase family protein [Bradyrhizobium sp. NBAIM18]